MKINPPDAKISKEKPFEDALFGREGFAKALTNLLRNAEENLVIFVNAPWGAGKTTFSKMWRTYLKEDQKLDVIYFDAYAADYFDDPFVCFSGAILGLVDNRLNEGKGLVERKDFKEKAVEVGKSLGSLALKVGLKAATLNIIEVADLAQAKEIASEIATGVSEVGAEAIERKIDGYSKETKALDDFKTSLAKLAAKVREEQGFPLTIIVDELDRCRPDFALGLLERIKHLFDVEGVAFVLLVNRAQIENYIRTVYGGRDAESYLLKFGSLFVDLPNRMREDIYESGHKEYCHRLASHYDLPDQSVNSDFLATSVGIFSNHFDLTLREIERVFTTVALYYGSLTPNPHRFPGRSENEWLVALLSILKAKVPELYSSLSKRTVNVEQFYKETKLNDLKVRSGESFYWPHMNALLEFYLMAEEELKKAQEQSGEKNSELRQIASRWGGTTRNMVIPQLCSSLDRFSVRPS